jgi:hypothetical protein
MDFHKIDYVTNNKYICTYLDTEEGGPFRV